MSHPLTGYKFSIQNADGVFEQKTLPPVTNNVITERGLTEGTSYTVKLTAIYGSEKSLPVICKLVQL